MPYKNIEDKRANSKLWKQKNADKVKVSLKKYMNKNPKVFKKASWKYQGIISNDWDKTYDYYINCNYCEYCDKKFKDSIERQLDHDHNINDDVNIRGVLCRDCNLNDVFDGYFKQLLLN